jgi:hypothetical protein
MKTPNNPVAKHCHKFNRPNVEEDKKKTYQRKSKHKGQDFGPFSI